MERRLAGAQCGDRFGRGELGPGLRDCEQSLHPGYGAVSPRHPLGFGGHDLLIGLHAGHHFVDALD
jgi:hypothetical protein